MNWGLGRRSRLPQEYGQARGRGTYRGYVSDNMSNDKEKAEENLTGRRGPSFTRSQTIHRQRGTMKSVEEGDAGKAVSRPLYLPRLKVRRAGTGPGHGRGMGKRKQRDGDLIALTSMGKREREHWRWCRCTLSHTEALQIKQKPFLEQHISHRYSEESSRTTNTVIF